MTRILCLAILLASCAATAAESPFLPLTARGQEPGWFLKASAEGITFSTQGGETVTAPLPRPEVLGDAVRYTAPSVAFEIRQAVCHDAMSGMPYPLSVTVLGSPARQGCGGEPADLLAGAWRVVEVNGSPAPSGQTLGFQRASISGHSGCNRFSASVEMTGEGLTLGPAVATRMACPEPAMSSEQRLLRGLESVDRFDIDGRGRLLLFRSDRLSVVAAR